MHVMKHARENTIAKYKSRIGSGIYEVYTYNSRYVLHFFAEKLSRFIDFDTTYTSLNYIYICGSLLYLIT